MDAFVPDTATATIDRGRQAFLLENRRLRVDGHLPSARLSLRLSEAANPLCSGATYGFRLGGSNEAGASRRPAIDIPHEVTGSRFDDAELDVKGAEMIIRHRWPDGPLARWRLRLADDRPWLLLDLELENQASHPIVVRSLQPLSVLPAVGGRMSSSTTAGWSWYTQGWQSWSPTAPRQLGDPPLQSRPPMSGPSRLPAGTHPSHWVTLLPAGEQSTALLAGYLTLGDLFGELRFKPGSRGSSDDGSFEAITHLGDVLLAPGQLLSSGTLLVEPVEDPVGALERYAALTARLSGARPWPKPVTGWVSWYCYAGRFNETDALREIETLSRLRERLPIEYIQIDDAWEADIGDWLTTSERFPNGMAPLAERIREAGFRPGLWLAPLALAESSQTFQQHPDWVVQDSRREPVLALRNWHRRVYGLDCSRPEVIEHLERVIRTVTNEWGYEMLKLDFLFTAAIDGFRFDPALTPARSYRRGLEALRSGAGEDVLILGCGAPLSPAVGIVDAMRVSPDVTTSWSSIVVPGQAEFDPRSPLAGRDARPATRNAIRDTLNRWWAHGGWWQNDADAWMVRPGQRLTPSERRSRATAVALSGGMLLLSDFMDELGEAEIGFISRLLPPAGISAKPLGDWPRQPYSLNDIPSLLGLSIERPFESWNVVALFNWDDRPRSGLIELKDLALPESPTGDYLIWDFWNQREVPLRLDGKTAGLGDLLPHDCRLLAIRPKLTRPQLAGTSFHFTQGGAEVDDCRWDERRQRLSLSLALPGKRDGAIILHVPEGKQTRSLRVNDVPQAVASEAGDNIRCLLRDVGEATIELDCPAG